jgi:hypothetical protein
MMFGYPGWGAESVFIYTLDAIPGKKCVLEMVNLVIYMR